jgi:hypothetical protein
MKGVFVIYLDVGNLAPTGADELLKKVKGEHKELFEKLKADEYEVMLLPTRPGSETKVEVLYLG